MRRQASVVLLACRDVTVDKKNLHPALIMKLFRQAYEFSRLASFPVFHRC